MVEATYKIYILPTGEGVVRVRKASKMALAAAGLFFSPLLNEAVAASATGPAEDEVQRQGRISTLDSIEQLVNLCLVDPDITADLLPLIDQLEIQKWALSDEVEPASPDLKEPERRWAERDFFPLMHGEAVLLLDMMCRRYKARPSDALGVPPELALAVDLAVSMRGARYESDRTKSQDEVEMLDAWGNVHKVPRKVADFSDMGSKHPNAKIIHADDLAKRYGEISLSAGGGAGGLEQMGRGGDGAIGSLSRTTH